MAKNKMIKIGISQRISDHLIEAILIFASVFFAFWLNDFRESRIQSETLKVSLQHIAVEMEYNHTRIESVYENYSNLIHEIDSLKNLDNSDWEKLYGYDLKSWHGMQTPMLRSTAYQTFLNTGIIDKAKFELAKTLADIYNMQTIIERLDNSFFEIATTDRGFTSLPKVRHLTGLYSELLPSLMLFYQQEGKKWLQEYGYNLEIRNEKLRNITSSIK